jgi:uncharacterized protein YdaU (DUF1376 family)
MATIRKNSGKAPSVQFYYKDFIADMMEFEPDVVGAWMLILCKIWHEDNGGSITKNISQLSRIMQTTIEKAEYFLEHFVTENIADVTRCNGKITITNRRSKREHKLKEQNRLRQEHYRACNGKYQKSNGDVTDKLHHPSSSSSSSTSIKEKNNIKKEISETALVTENQLKDIEIAWNSFAPNGYEIHDVATRHYHQLCSVIEGGEFSVQDLLETIDNYKQALSLKNSRTVPHQFGYFLTKKIDNFKPGTFDVKRFDKSVDFENDFTPKRRKGLALRL